MAVAVASRWNSHSTPSLGTSICRGYGPKKKKKKKKIEVYLIYSVVLVSGEQHSNSDIYIYIHIYIHTVYFYICTYVYLYIHICVYMLLFRSFPIIRYYKILNIVSWAIQKALVVYVTVHSID